MDSDENVRKGLFLALGLVVVEEETTSKTVKRGPVLNWSSSFTTGSDLSLRLGVSGEGLCRQASPMAISPVSSSRVSDEDEDGYSYRKKLRLTKQQSALLDESFKRHTSLHPKQRQALARQLNLRPRQVEVWFQNRRARTKVKQTEVDCEMLKKCCESLEEENRRLQKEVVELKAVKRGNPFYMEMAATAPTLCLCPSCERLVRDDHGRRSAAKNSSDLPFSMASSSSSNSQFFNNPFSIAKLSFLR